MIRNLITRFERTESVSDLPGSGTKHTVHTNAAVEAIQHCALDDPSSSTRCRSAQLGVSRLELKITPTASPQRGKTSPTRVLDMTLNNLMVKLQ